MNWSQTVGDLAARVRGAWRPPVRLDLNAWAEDRFYLSAESAAEPGRWRSIPYQRGILNAFTDPDVYQVSVMKSARVGWTKVVNAVVGYHMDMDPCPIMVVQPTIEDAQGYSKEEIAPMLRDCPALAAIAPAEKTRDGDNTILAKRYRGGSVSIVGANSPRGFRRVSRKVVLFDEVDGYPLSAGHEGDPIALGIRRTEYYWDRKIGAGSTPTIAGVSRIESLFLAGDQRRFYVPCPHCGADQVLTFPRFTWPTGRPDLAVYVCILCGAEVEHKDKRDMVEAGAWRAGPHKQFPDAPAPGPWQGHASFHIWAGYSYSPNATWGQLATEFVAATRGGQETLKTFVNTVLGEPWRERGEAPEWERLYQRRDRYAIGTCPAGVLLLTAGVDVQKDRLVYEVVGWGRDKRSWSIEAGVLVGDVSTPTPWVQLDALLERMFPHEGGALLPIQTLAVDSGAFTQAVYAWARTKPSTRVIAVKGLSTMQRGVLVGLPSAVEVTVRGRKLKRGYRIWPVNVDQAKTELYGWLGLVPPTDEERAAGAEDPPGFCRFPEHGEAYFQQLTAEQLVKTRTKRGHIVTAWEVIPGRENHGLDARNYARAAAFVAGIDRFGPHAWAALQDALASTAARVTEAAASETTPPTPARVAPAPGPTPAPAPPSAPPAPTRPAWVPQRPNWLKGGR